MIRRLALIFAVTFSAGASATSDDFFPHEGVEIAPNRELVVMLHGFGRNSMSMWLLAQRLEHDGFEVHRIGYRSLRTTTEKMLNTVSGKIQHCCGNSKRTIHFVGHSLGGLLIRAYLGIYHNHEVGRVVLIGPPNEGTPFVDKFHNSWWMRLAGPAAQDLGTAEDSFPNSIEAEPYYPLGVIAGDTDSEDMLNLESDADDGLIPVASTVVAGMTDFIVLKANHSLMRYDREVADQTASFLIDGRFTHDEY